MARRSKKPIRIKDKPAKDDLVDDKLIDEAVNQLVTIFLGQISRSKEKFN